MNDDTILVHIKPVRLENYTDKIARGVRNGNHGIDTDSHDNETDYFNRERAKIGDIDIEIGHNYIYVTQ